MQDWWDGARYGGYLVVPLNNAGNQALVQDIVDTENVRWFPISPEEYRLLEPLFDRFNKAFLLSIGESTGELLSLKDVVAALELARDFELHADGATSEAARKVVQAVETMMEHGAYLEFDL